MTVEAVATAAHRGRLGARSPGSRPVRRLVRAAVRAAVSAERVDAGVPTRPLLIALSARQRAVFALAVLAQVPPSEIGRALRLRPVRVAAEARSVLDALVQTAGARPAAAEEWARSAWLRTGPGEPGNLLALVPGVRAAYRRRRWVRLVSAVGALGGLAVVGAMGLTGSPRPAPAHQPALPAAPGLLGWATRGGLADDSSFQAAATATWRAEFAVDPVRQLFLGVVDGRRVAVLEGIVGVQTPLLALIGPPAGAPRGSLRVERFAVLRDPPVPLVIVTSGARTPAGWPVRHLLVGPGVSRVQWLGPGGYRTLAVRDGLSAGFAAPGSTAPVVRVYAGPRLLLVGSCGPYDLQPLAEPAG